MSHVEHQTISVTSWDKEALSNCRQDIEGLGLIVTEVIDSPNNCFYSFFVAPSGSKAGWPEADAHLEKIRQAREAIDCLAYEDGSNCLKYSVSVYGDHYG